MRQLLLFIAALINLCRRVSMEIRGISEKYVKEFRVKKLLLSIVMVLVFSISANAAEVYTNPAGNPVDQFTGKYWMESTPDNQRAFLFGIDTAVAVEYTISNRKVAQNAKAGKKPVYTLSPFERGWMEAFKDMSREQIATDVTAWYKAHPDALDRPVMDVIWHEVVMPRLKAGK